MALGKPDIHFNFATGSDTLASGAPSAMTAINGANASLAASTLVDLSGDSPDLSSVPTDGSAAIWIDTSSGAQWREIIAVDDTAKTVTVQSAYGVTESGRNWAIGGKRKTLEAATALFNYPSPDWSAYWNVVLEDDQEISSAVTVYAYSVGNVIRSSVDGAIRTVTQTSADTPCFIASGSTRRTILFKDIKLENSNATKTSVACCGIQGGTSGSGAVIAMLRCVLGDAINQLYVGTSDPVVFIDSLVHHCISYGLTSYYVIRSRVVNNGGDGLWIANSTMSIFDSVFCDNGGHGIAHELDGSLSVFSGCTIANNGGDGIGYSDGSGGAEKFLVQRCSITGNAGYGIGRRGQYAIVVDCNFGTGASANGLGAANADGPLLEFGSLNSDPAYTDDASGDYSLGSGSPNLNAGTIDIGGVSLPSSIGAIDGVSGGGGGSTVIVVED